MRDFTIKKGCLAKYRGNGGDVEIPEGVTSIGEEAFDGCKRMTSITIPDSVTSIGKSAFSRCSSLTGITIPDSVTSIGDWAFHDCSSLTSITIPDSVTTIGKSAFKGCKGFADQAGLIIVRNELFDCIIEATSITIPDSVTSIGDGAFFGCSSLTSITIPDSVTSIGDWAFHDCSSLTSITIPDSVTRIGDEAFRGCSNLRSITIPDSVTGIGKWAFYGCSSLKRVYVQRLDTWLRIGFQGYSCNPCCNGAELYIGGKLAKEITIPDSVTSIGDSAFAGCSSLTSISIPVSVTRIGNGAFYDCSSLASITIPDSVTRIGNWAFHGCSSLTDITIPDSVTSIGDVAFSGCSSLRSIHIANVSLLPKELHGLACAGMAEEALAHPERKAEEPCIPIIRKRLAKPDFIKAAVANLALLTLMCREKLITAARFDLYWQAAEQAGDPAVTALLLDYRQNGIGVKKLTAARKAKQKKEALEGEHIYQKAIRRQKTVGIQGLVFAITGSLNTFQNRNEAKAYIEKLGGKLATSVSANVDYLVTNDTDSGSEKNRRAASLGIEVISEADFNHLICRRFKDQPEIVIPSWVTEIADRAFKRCRSLTSIIIPDSVTSIGDGAFRDCSSLTISTPAGSCAEAYAKQHGIPVIHI